MLERFVNRFKADGVDHIRISPQGETKLGRYLSKDWRYTFFVPDMGEFTSPVCFANWLCTGDEDARHNVQFRVNESVVGYLQFVLYGKFYQLSAMKGLLFKEMKNLPFAVYKLHGSGVKEFDRWKEYPSEVKLMIEHILDDKRGPKTPYDWHGIYPGIEDRIGGIIREMVGEEGLEAAAQARVAKAKARAEAAAAAAALNHANQTKHKKKKPVETFPEGSITMIEPDDAETPQNDVSEANTPLEVQPPQEELKAVPETI
jgi:hypothetical protein